MAVWAADGSTLSGIVHCDICDVSGYVIADSGSREYSVAEIKAMGLTDAGLCIARNEPFARQGYHFKNSGRQACFGSCGWYKDTGNTSNLAGVAAVNNFRLREVAGEKSSSEMLKELATS